ncbi:phage tail protein [Aeribacillus pallidus]|nr:phage tail protein [Aeribacillus pallidus]
MYVRDLEGNEYPAQATSTKELELNGNQSFSVMFVANKVNDIFIDNIDRMWEVVDHDGVTHKIIYVKKQGKGNRLTVEVKAIPLFFDKFDTMRIYTEYNEHMTAREFFSLVFADTGFDFVLVDSFEAVEWEGLGGGETRLSMFKKGLERYKCEFRIVGNTVYLESQIGRDTGFMYRHRLNASNIVQENDASEFYTYAKGYGDYSDEDGWQWANLIREYTSPLAQIPGIGIREAPPIMDGRITQVETMDEQLKTLVDESLKISVSADIHDLRRQGYALAQPELGDRVFLIDERIGLDTEVRVVQISITKDWKGNVIDLKLTFGTPSITKRYQSNIQTAVERVNEIMEGRTKIPFSVLDNAVIKATKELQGVMSELKVPPNGGLMAVDKNDPNKIVVFNAAGIGISDDGGQTFRTAMTGSGIVADVITAGTLRGITVISDDGQGNSVTIESGSLVSKINNRDMVKIYDYEIYFYDPGHDDASPDYGTVATLSSSWKTDNPNIRGFGIVGYKDYFYIGSAETDTNAKHFFEINFSESNTYLYGEGRDEKTIGRLDLQSVRSGAYNYQTSKISIENNYYNNTRWGGVFVYTGRGTESPGANKRFGFEVWQYDGSGGLNQHLIIDKGSNGKSYAGIYTDEAWLPSQTYLKYKNGYYYNALGIGIDSNVSDIRGSLNGNALLFVDYWDFNVDPNVRYQYGRYNMSGAENIFAVFVQPMGGSSVFYNARAYNISNSGFDVYVAKNDASDTPSATRIQLQLIIIYEPKA